jgi:hypothetical protein
MEKLAPTFTRHKCREGNVLTILFLITLFVRHYRIHALLHLRETPSFWDIWREF